MHRLRIGCQAACRQTALDGADELIDADDDWLKILWIHDADQFFALDLRCSCPA